jgi:hypothetical protein
MFNISDLDFTDWLDGSASEVSPKTEGHQVVKSRIAESVEDSEYQQ